MSWFRRETPTDRTLQLMGGRHRLEGLFRSGAHPDQLQREIDILIGISGRNKNIKALADHPGWQEIEADLSRRAIGALRELPGNVIKFRWVKALAQAQYIETINQVLGLVNETLLESQRVANLINTKIAIQARLNEEKEQ